MPTKKSMATIKVNVYSSQDRYSRFVSTIGELTGGGVTHEQAHAGFTIEFGGIECHYDLRQDGVNTEPLPDPQTISIISVPPHTAYAVFQRVGYYRNKG